MKFRIKGNSEGKFIVEHCRYRFLPCWRKDVVEVSPEKDGTCPTGPLKANWLDSIEACRERAQELKTVLKPYREYVVQNIMNLD